MAIRPRNMGSCITSFPLLTNNMINSTNAAIMNGVIAQVSTAMILCTRSTKIIPGLKIMTNSFDILPNAQRFLCERNTFQFCGTMVKALARSA